MSMSPNSWNSGETMALPMAKSSVTSSPIIQRTQSKLWMVMSR